MAVENAREQGRKEAEATMLAEAAATLDAEGFDARSQSVPLNPNPDLSITLTLTTNASMLSLSMILTLKDIFQ